MDEINELTSFLSSETPVNIKLVALRHILGLTGTDSGCKILLENSRLVQLLISLICDNPVIATDACLAVINLSSSEHGSSVFLSAREDGLEDHHKYDVVAEVMRHITNPKSSLADQACMILANLSRASCNVETILKRISVEHLFNAFTNINYNELKANLHYLGPVFSNLSQSATFRRYVLDHDKGFIQKLLPFTQFKESAIRRGGVVGTIRNCCFDSDSHEWLLGPEVNLIPYIILPLAGPEEFTEEETDRLPIELQYLPDDKTRESDPDIRKMLLESLNLLCAKNSCREILREANIYVILREYHKWEQDRNLLLACENVVDILIRKEEEIGESNLLNVEVPTDLHEKFKQMDESYIND